MAPARKKKGRSRRHCNLPSKPWKKNWRLRETILFTWKSGAHASTGNTLEKTKMRSGKRFAVRVQNFVPKNREGIERLLFDCRTQNKTWQKIRHNEHGMFVRYGKPRICLNVTLISISHIRDISVTKAKKTCNYKTSKKKNTQRDTVTLAWHLGICHAGHISVTYIPPYIKGGNVTIVPTIIFFFSCWNRLICFSFLAGQMTDGRKRSRRVRRRQCARRPPGIPPSRHFLSRLYRSIWRSISKIYFGWGFSWKLWRPV